MASPQSLRTHLSHTFYKENFCLNHNASLSLSLLNRKVVCIPARWCHSAVSSNSSSACCSLGAPSNVLSTKNENGVRKRF
jgi:hypothetical protein